MDNEVRSYARSIHHDGSRRYVRNQTSPGADPQAGDEILIRLRAGLNAPIQRILLRTCPDGEQHFTPLVCRDDTACRWWEGTLSMNMPAVGYRFLILAEDGVFWYNGAGLHAHNPTDAEDFRLLAGYAAPAWTRDAVFYQIFPDRFCDGDPALNVRDDEFVYRGAHARARGWDEMPAREGPGAMVEFFGGDLPGIEQRLDYLADLGVNAIYLNPIFTARSNHRYDVIDYAHVDPHLGGNDAFISLRRATAERGMHLMLDIVPNHCGVEHPWFQSALADSNAPTADYFTFHRHPLDYASWLGVKSLPKLNYRSAALRDVMYAGSDSIFRYWLRPPFALDGWRIDVANMLGRQGAHQLGLEVARGIRQAVKEENPSAYLLGENFFDASEQLQGDCWDAVMNYAGFMLPLGYWLARFQVDQHAEPRLIQANTRWTTAALADTWQAYRAAIPWTIARQQFNLIGSHDTARVHSMLGGNVALHRLAAGLLMTYVGVPSVFYGDEIGMEGENALLARAPMRWDPAQWHVELYSFYRALIALRRRSQSLSSGGYQVLLAEEDTIAYLRDADGEWLIVVGQRGPGTRTAGGLPVADGAVPDGTEFTEVFTGRSARVEGGHLPLPALAPGIEIYRAQFG